MKNLSIGQRVKALRDGIGLSQEKLAAKAGLTKEYISRIERDQTNNVGYETYKAVATALGVHVSLLLFGETFAPNTMAAADIEKLRIPGEELLPLTREEADMILDFRSISHKGEKRTVLDVVESFGRRKK